MVRLKFLVFALLVLGLWVAHLSQVSTAVSAAAVEQAAGHAFAGAEAAASVIAGRRAEVTAAGLAVATAPRVEQLARGPGSERPKQLAALAGTVVPEPLRAGLVVGIGTPEEPAFVSADGTRLEGVDPAALTASAGSDLFRIGEVWHLFAGFPLVTGVDGKVLVHGAVGLPLVVAERLSDAAAGAGLDSLVLMEGKTALVQVGKPVDAASLELGQDARVIERGGTGDFLGLTLPAFTAAGGAPLRVASRQPVPGTSLAAVAVITVMGSSRTLADYQGGFALPVLIGLLLLTALFAWAIAPRKRGAVSEEASPPAEVVPAPATIDQPSGLIAEAAPLPAAAVVATPDAEAADAEALPAAELLPEDGAFAADAEAMPQAEAQPAPELPFPQGDGNGAGFPFAESPSGTSPTMVAPGNPGDYAFGEAAAPPYAAYGGAEGEPEATRVAMIPQHLIDASARVAQTSPGIQSPAVFSPPPPPVAPQVAPPLPAARSDEEHHYQEVYRDFVSTREKCGESADGLTYDKFVLKLRKNKEQLVQKYACKTVRFQVYVKDGKAALKATPVRE